MFKEIVSKKGFWKSVFTLAIVFSGLFTVVKWAIEGFKISYFTDKNPITHFLLLFLAGTVYGFFVTYGKLKSQLKDKNK